MEVLRCVSFVGVLGLRVRRKGKRNSPNGRNDIRFLQRNSQVFTSVNKKASFRSEYNSKVRYFFNVWTVRIIVVFNNLSDYDKIKPCISAFEWPYSDNCFVVSSLSKISPGGDDVQTVDVEPETLISISSLFSSSDDRRRTARSELSATPPWKYITNTYTHHGS